MALGRQGFVRRVRSDCHTQKKQNENNLEFCRVGLKTQTFDVRGIAKTVPF